LYNILNEIFKSADYIKYTGDDLDQLKFEGGIDYYLRKKNQYLLFESKDVLIKATVKGSGNYHLIEQELKEKIYKALKQLTRNVKFILSKEIPLDKNYNSKNLTFYPILIVHNDIFNVAGLNNILNDWLKEIIAMDPEIYRIRNSIIGITLIDIDTLTYSMQHLQKNQNITEIILKYQKEWINDKRYHLFHFSIYWMNIDR
jgi:hypothetical protein